MKTLLVRQHDIETDAPRAGEFRSVALGGGRIPRLLLGSTGTFCVDTTDPVFALTYDDGPDPASTPGVLDMLARHGARATFFVLAEPARRHPELIARMIDDGHEIALHGDDHRSLLTKTTREAVDGIRRARATVEDVAGRRISLYRPPYGEHTFAQTRAVRRLGLDFVIWSGDAFDWVDDEASAVASRAISAVFPGAILLLHDTRADPETLGPGQRLPSFDRAEVLESILASTRAGGLREATVSELTARYSVVRSIARERMVAP